MITDQQVKLLRQKMKQGLTQQAAAAAAGMSERSARKYQRGPLPSQRKEPRSWRTRQDPFEEVFEEHIEPLLVADEERQLRAPTVLKLLHERCPGRFDSSHLRTLQRRIRTWRAQQGPDREVYFPQQHPPGREAAIDFTHCNDLNVTIQGERFDHMFFAFRLAFSAWIWLQLAFSETFEALISGVQGALWGLGGAPEVVHHDNLSAATHELRPTKGRKLNARFKDFLDHYGMRSVRINPGKSNENGGVEKGHDLVKSCLRQELVIRGSADFESREAYETWAREVIELRLNSQATDRLAEERKALRSLPAVRLPEYTKHEAKVRKWSTIHIARRNYSLPSRLIGHRIKARQYADHIEFYFEGQLVESVPRLRGEQTARIDYRHIIWSLVRKPGAFARYKWREELFPTLTFRLTYDALHKWRGERADIEYVRILHLAASTMQSQVETALEMLLEEGERFDYAAVKALIQPDDVDVPRVSIPAPDLAQYDRLLQGGAR